MKIVKSRPASIAEVKELLEERKKDKELEYEQAQAAEHAEKFSRWTTSEADKTADGLVKKGVVDRETAVKLVDVSPKYNETLKAIIAKNKIEMNEEDAAEVLKQLQK
jgi:DNA-directed RNA polymerase subunit F